MRYNHLDLLPYMAFKPLSKRMTLEGGKSSPPPAPDYAAAAKETAAGNLEAAKYAAAANRVNQVTPYGNLTYTQNPTTGSTFDQAGYDHAMQVYQQQLSQSNQNRGGGGGGSGIAGVMGGTFNGQGGNRSSRIAPNRADYTTGNGYDTYTATQTLSPAEQAKLDKNNLLSNGLLDTAQLGLSGVNKLLQSGFDFNSLPAQQVNAGQTAQDAIMARLNPQFTTSEDQLRTRLINQGVQPGSQAWDNDFRNFNNSKNDAYSQAALQGIGVGQQARQQALQEQEFGRTEGVNIINALRTGNQVQQPSFVNPAQQATTAGPDLLGAAQSKYQNELSAYNAQNASSSGLFGGLASAGATIASGGVKPWWLG